MTDEDSKERFQPRTGFICAAIVIPLGFLIESGWIDSILAGILSFIVSGAAHLFKGVLLYLLVFFAVMGAAAWGLIHFVIP